MTKQNVCWELDPSLWSTPPPALSAVGISYLTSHLALHAWRLVRADGCVGSMPVTEGSRS
jgi:hypothetical protein